MLNLDEVIKETEIALENNPNNPTAFQIYGIARLLKADEGKYTTKAKNEPEQPKNTQESLSRFIDNRSMLHTKEIMPSQAVLPLQKWLSENVEQIQSVWVNSTTDEERQAIKDFARKISKYI